MEKDIERKIDVEFGHESSLAKKILEDFESEMELSPRISRCIVFLAKGSIEKLKNVIEEAKIDWRDVIMDAESEDFEFNQPFT